MRIKTAPFVTCLLSIFVGLLAGSCSRPLQKNAEVLPEKGLCAHRGAMDSHPENTIPAFREAIRLGVHMIEFDLQMTKDSVLVIMHDETVDRTTNGKGKVKDLTFSEIRQLDAGIKKGSDFSGVQVPTFEETLAIMPRNVWLNCHLKGDTEEGRRAAEIIVKARRTHQAFLACGEKAAISARSVDPKLLICNMEEQFRRNADEYVKSTIRINAQFLQLVRNKEPNERQMAELKRHGVRVNYFYAKTPDEVDGLLKRGVDFILVNEIANFMPAMKALNIKPVQPEF